MILRETLRDLLQDVTQRRTQQEALVQTAREAVARARFAVQSAEDQATVARGRDARLHARYQALQSYTESLLTPPPVFLEHLLLLSTQQGETARQRDAAAQLVRQHQEALEDAEARLHAAQATLATLHQAWREVSEHLARVAGDETAP